MDILRIKLPDNGQTTWLVLDENYVPVLPIVEFLEYERSRPRSPYTLRAYAFALKIFWEFLQEWEIEWTVIFGKRARLYLARFREWLKKPRMVAGAASLRPARQDSTVKLYDSAVRQFYKYHLEGESQLPATRKVKRVPYKGNHNYRPFLAHLERGHSSSSGQQSKMWYEEDYVSVPKRRPKTLTSQQVEVLLKACNSKRDKFLLALIYRSGFRIGQALGLRHEDVVSWDNKLLIVPRNNNVNGARAKVREEGKVDIEPEVMALYTDYLLEELENIDSDYVFVNLAGDEIGKPLEYATAYDLFRRLRRKTGIYVTPHMFRHTHATELFDAGWEVAYVQERLQHASPQTTAEIYIHVGDEKVKEAHRLWVETRKRSP